MVARNNLCLSVCADVCYGMVPLIEKQLSLPVLRGFYIITVAHTIATNVYAAVFHQSPLCVDDSLVITQQTIPLLLEHISKAAAVPIKAEHQRQAGCTVL